MNTERSLTYQPVEAAEKECPPEDTYNLEIVSVSPWEEKFGVLENGQPDTNIINTQTAITFEIFDFDYDPEVDDKDWNSTKVKEFYVFWRKYVDKDVESAVWRDDRSNSYALISAVIGHTPEPGEEINPFDFPGEKLKATIKEKKSGWPKVVTPMPYKRRRAKKAAAETENPYDEDAVA